MALVRSWGGNTVVMSERVAGITKAAPMPEIARPTMICIGASASPETVEPMAKTTSPAMRAFFRPYLSPSAPAARRSPAKITA